MTADEKLAAQMALKAENDRRLKELKGSTDAEKLKGWMTLGFHQPAPTEVVEIKQNTGLSWNKLREFIKDM